MNLLHPVPLLATWFGSGLLPKMPGTWGSLAALPFAWVLMGIGGWPLLLLATLVIFPVGVWSGGAYAARQGREDPGPVVIDEVAGQWLTLCVVPLDPLLFGLGFVLFRLADIFKPWPVSVADRRIKGGLGIMLDDILAAVYAGAALYGIGSWLGRI
ncbi:hypothetical protein JCM17960_21570 [Magnetospira thiophila]